MSWCRGLNRNTWHELCNYYSFAEMYIILVTVEKKFFTVGPEKSDQYCANLL